MTQSATYTILYNMDAITYTEARQTLAQTIQRVCRDHDPIIITRKREDSVVMMSLEDYDSLTETAYLLKSPKNARRLLAAVGELKRGKGAVRKLAE
ncbi:MAG: type II toxin-antitoxin system prevent-host-death family antitoxin [Thermoguttaceae bacterium]